MSSSALDVEAKRKISRTLEKQLRLVKGDAADQFTMQLIQVRVSAANKRLNDGSFGKCTCCSKNIIIGLLEKDPSQPYCKGCNEIFSQTRKMIHQKLSSFKRSLAEVDRSITSTLDCSKKPGKDAADMANPDISAERFRRGFLQKDILQCQKVLRAMATGEYEGVCRYCEEPLAEERLKVKPHAEFCTPCAQDIEKGRKTRPA